uniref:uncharacterized protein LOC120344148 isoform X2 n=1 Tax=Styela clava TaxID=7725 RepID=UPI00193ACA8F|nr:uncharacterized protein LOC120344148 isoform X2 [Styela clava]
MKNYNTIVGILFISMTVLGNGLIQISDGNIDQNKCHGHAHEELYLPSGGCHNYYYQCVHGTGLKLSCAGSLSFNEKIQRCDWSSNIPDCPEYTGRKGLVETTKATLSTTETWSEETKPVKENVICGRRLPSILVARVAGGNDAIDGAWPWQAALVKNPQRMVFQIRPQNILGGGSVINSRWILTAGHIFDGIFAESLATNNWRGFLVILGMTRFPEIAESLPKGTLVFEPEFVIRHERYNGLTYDYDVALIKFGNALQEVRRRLVPYRDLEEIPFDGRIRPVCLPCSSSCGTDTARKENFCKQQWNVPNSADINYQSMLVTVTGFGSILPRNVTSSNFHFPKILQQTVLQLLDHDSYKSGVKFINEIFASVGNEAIATYTKQMICATGSDSSQISDACQGDSGGPLVAKTEISGGKVCWTQLGIVSWGLGCASSVGNSKRLPGYYTNVATVIDWILEKAEMQKLTTTMPPSKGNTTISPDLSRSSCPKPNPIKNGRFRVYDKKRSVGSIVRYYCNDGFMMSGNNLVTCGLNGRWEPTPTCTEGRCPTPKAPLHGIVFGDSVSLGSKIRFECKAGYQLNGEPISICTVNKITSKWSGKPRTCKIKACVPPNTPVNGKVIGRDYSRGAQIAFECNEGYILKGRNISKCNPNGSWSGRARQCKDDDDSVYPPSIL